MPELPEKESSPGPEEPSDEEESALQWLSEPPPEFGRHLSGFGHVFTLLNSMVTERTSHFVKAKQGAASTELPPHSSLQVGSRASPCEQTLSLVAM